ncbi:MAG: hypothetical protein U5K38_03275 [Woeseiaceae bacterium]|nr:hypothetical protein [Woeseiaceae bacterium]
MSWGDFIHELNYHPCVDFAQCKPINQLNVTYDGIRWSSDEFLELIKAHAGRLVDSPEVSGAGLRMETSGKREHELFCYSKIPPMKA